MKVLVTGASGFTGIHLTKRLCHSGIDVRALVRDNSKNAALNGLDIEIIQGDITDSVAMDQAVRGVEKVFHIAAAYRTAGIPDKAYWDVNVNGTEHLLKSSLKNGITRFIHCSTVGVHGHIDNLPANETHYFKPGDIYQRTKLEGELRATQFGKETGLPVVVIRPSAIYGPGDMRLYKLFKVASKKIIFILGSGNIFYHMIYIDDLIDAFMLASENDKAIGEAFIIGGSERLTLNSIIDIITEELKILPIKIHLPVWPFQLLGSITESICIPLRIEPPIHSRRVDFFTKSRAFDITKATQMLKFSPKFSIRAGVARTVSWYRESGLL